MSNTVFLPPMVPDIGCVSVAARRGFATGSPSQVENSSWLFAAAPGDYDQAYLITEFRAIAALHRGRYSASSTQRIRSADARHAPRRVPSKGREAAVRGCAQRNAWSTTGNIKLFGNKARKRAARAAASCARPAAASACTANTSRSSTSWPWGNA